MKTEITGLSKSNNSEIVCFIRRKQIANTPEERVRQSLLQKMVCELGFPRGLISVERALADRRYDLVCYSKEMVPLLLVECKAGAIDQAAIQQAFGYNETLQAPFICLVGLTEIITFWKEREKIGSVPFLPTYKELYAISQRR